MKDVAKAAGVSIGTVSKVINRSGNVSPKIRERVLLAISLLNYKPNGIARSLKNSRTNIIGVLLPDLNDIYLMKILKTIEIMTSTLEYKFIFCTSNGEQSREVKALQWLIEKRVDGILFYPSSEDLPEVEIPASIPIVLIERQLREQQFTAIMHENVEVCRKLIQPLVDEGHKRFLFLHGLVKDSIQQSRLNGFNKSLEYFGLNKCNQYYEEFNHKKEVSSLHGLVSKQIFRASEATCIVATNPNLLSASLIALNKMGLLVKKDKQICGFGEIDPYGIFEPKIRIAREQPEELVRVALDFLFEKIIKQAKIKITSRNYYITFNIKD